MGEQQNDAMKFVASLLVVILAIGALSGDAADDIIVPETGLHQIGGSIALTEVTATTDFKTLVQLASESPNECFKLAASAEKAAKTDATEKTKLLNDELKQKKDACDQKGDKAVREAESAKTKTATAFKDAETKFNAAKNKKLSLQPVTFSVLESGKCNNMVKKDPAFKKQAKTVKTLKDAKDKAKGARDQAKKAYDKAKKDQVAAKTKCHCGLKTWYTKEANTLDKDLTKTHGAELTKAGRLKCALEGVKQMNNCKGMTVPKVTRVTVKATGCTPPPPPPKKPTGKMRQMHWCKGYSPHNPQYPEKYAVWTYKSDAQCQNICLTYNANGYKFVGAAKNPTSKKGWKNRQKCTAAANYRKNNGWTCYIFQGAMHTYYPKGDQVACKANTRMYWKV